MATFVFTGGGSAGHALPSIRIAEAMRQLGHNAVFIGSRESVEERLCAHYHIDFLPVTTGKLSRSHKLSAIGAALKNVRGIHESRKLLKRISPDGLFSSGGFVSVPVVLAAHSLEMAPIVIHACDLSLGLANRLCLPSATHLTCTFADTCRISKRPFSPALSPTRHSARA